MPDENIEVPSLVTGSGLARDPREVVAYVGMSGRLEVKEPYTFVLDRDTEYTCVAVTSIAGMIANGEDPWLTVYEPNGATEALYEEDLLNNRVIVTIQSGFAEVFTVPNSALLNLPMDNGIRYYSQMLGVDLGPLPETIDLSILKSDIIDLIKARIGVESTIYENVTGAALIISHDNHRGIEAARQALRGNNQSNLMKIAELTEQLLKANTLRAKLEDYIAETLSPIEP